MNYFGPRNGDNGLTGGAIWSGGHYDKPVPAPCWTCHCGHTEQHANPAKLRKLALKHASIHAETVEVD